MSADYRRHGGAKRRSTDPPADLRANYNIVRDPFTLCVDRLTRDLHLRQRLGSRAHSILTERIHDSVKALARARRAGVTVPIPDASVSRIVDAVVGKTAPPPVEEPALDDCTGPPDPAYECASGETE